MGGNDRKLKRNPIKRPIPAIAAISDGAPYTIQQYIDPDWNTNYKTIPPDSQNNASYTFRLAIAPGDDSFYEKAYGSGVEFHSAEKDGRIYAGLSCSVAFATVATARNLAATLNAKLVEPASIHEWMRIHALVFPYSHSPAFIGLHFQDDAWRRFSDGAAVNSEHILPTDTYGGNVYLIANKTNFAAIKPTFSIPSILLQWDSKSQWEHRGDALRGNSQAPSSANSIERIITIGGRRFALARIPLFPSYIVAPFCRYMDVKPAVIKDKKEMEEACHLLSDVNGTIALGALRHYDDWQWFDGTIESISPWPERLTDHSIAPSPMLDCLALENGRLVSAASVSFILLELDLETENNGIAYFFQEYLKEN